MHAYRCHRISSSHRAHAQRPKATMGFLMQPRALMQQPQRRRLLALLLVVSATCVSSWSPRSQSMSCLRAKVHTSLHQRLTTTSSATAALRMSSSDQDNSGNGSKSKKKTAGVYARPSAAIERGSGFFIPGLEGSRVRLLFGILALVLTYVNNSLGSVTTGGFGVSETVAVLAGILLLLQAGVEFGQELGFGVQQTSGASDATIGDAGPAGTSAAASSANLEQRIAPSLMDRGDEAVDSIKWIAATYVALTPASHVIVVADTGEGTEPTLLYELGDFENRSSEIETGAKAAIDEVYKSKGGRISLPADHPAAMNLLPESGRRCVLLQRISAASSGDASGVRRLCMVVGSNQLLQAFTKNDLRWLGRLAQYSEKAL